jgi:hypothetical protein
MVGEMVATAGAAVGMSLDLSSTRAGPRRHE